MFVVRLLVLVLGDGEEGLGMRGIYPVTRLAWRVVRVMPGSCDVAGFRRRVAVGQDVQTRVVGDFLFK